jgi:hypothetical protein
VLLLLYRPPPVVPPAVDQAERWPAAFPPLLLRGYGLTPQKATIRSSIDAGAAGQRRIFSATMTTTQFSVIFRDRLGFETFEAWWVYRISMGARWFAMAVKNGAGRTECACRFTKQYTATPHTGRDDCAWLVTGEIEIRNLPVLTSNELEARLNA